MNKEILEKVQQYISEADKNNRYLITAEELDKELKAGGNIFILDIRKPEDFAKEKIDLAYNVAYSDLNETMDVLPMDMKIVVVCYTGQLSCQVETLFRMLGYNAYSLAGGMNNGWKAAGLKTNSGCNT